MTEHVPIQRPASHHIPRSCSRCGEPGPRIWLKGVGYAHHDCLTKEEQAARRAAYDQGRRR